MLKLVRMEYFQKANDQTRNASTGKTDGKYLPTGEPIWFRSDAIWSMEVIDGVTHLSTKVDHMGCRWTVQETPEQILELMK